MLPPEDYRPNFFFIFGLYGPHKNRGWVIPMFNIKKVN